MGMLHVFIIAGCQNTSHRLSQIFTVHFTPRFVHSMETQSDDLVRRFFYNWNISEKAKLSILILSETTKKSGIKCIHK